VNVDAATYTNSVGSTELKAVWTDPDFDPSLHAFYYARALEIETPRWSTLQAKELGVAPPDVVAATVKERAWSSPIWYAPSADARKGAMPGTTVADLTTKGATALGEDQLKALLVGKSIWLRNAVTGQLLKVRYDEDGNALILHAGRSANLPSESGDLARESYQNVPTPYEIKNGKLVTTFANSPIETTFYKSGDSIRAARSNEFGYANYEVVPPPANLVPEKAK
jgi:Protein of unknown function (DUF3604)